MTALPIGTKLQNGAFTIGKILGQGGFGITYCGSDTRLNRVVAIKEFFPVGCTRVGLDVHSHGLFDVASYSNARAKFLQEAQSLAQFRHAGIVHVYTFCEENNTAYLVMEFLRGQTLSQLVESRGALPEKEAVEIIEKVCEAVEELHVNKTLHRDIKPDNIILCDDGRVVLIDFGLTKKVEETLGSSTRQLTATTRFGSDGFAPPEQYLKSGIMGTYSDVYALGATLYFLLTSKVPPSAIERLAGEDLTPPEHLKQVTQNVNDAVMRAMGLKGDLRLQTTKILIAALNDLKQLKQGALKIASIQSSTHSGLTLPHEQSEIEVNDITSFTEAINLVNDSNHRYDTIRLQPGTYRFDEQIIFNRSVRLIGANVGGKTVIRSTASGCILFLGKSGRKYNIYDITFQRFDSNQHLVVVSSGIANFYNCVFESLDIDADNFLGEDDWRLIAQRIFLDKGNVKNGAAIFLGKKALCNAVQCKFLNNKGVATSDRIYFD